MKQIHLIASASGLLLLLSGCASLPEPMSQAEIKAIAQADREEARKDVAPLIAPLTLEEAIARGLKYNLDHRTRLLEQALASGQLEAGGFDMLPRVLASAGYRSRDNSSNSFAPIPGTDKPSSTESPISADRTHTTSDLGLSWNILDFGISYYNSKQNADRVLVAAERRRKAMHVLIQSIRSAFWRVASAQRLQAEVNNTIREAEASLADARKVSEERIKAPADALRYQRALLENLRTLESIQREMATARIELAQLINVPAGSLIRVAEPASFLLEDRLMRVDVTRMEELAMAHNADIREQVYNARIAATETRKALLRLFPALTVSFTGKHDSNSFLVNQSWQEVAAQVSFNLINLLSGPSQMDVAEAGVRLAEQRRVAMQMAVFTQLHLARQDFETALRQFMRSDAIWEVDRQLYEMTAKGEAQQTQGAQARVAARTGAILSLLRRYQTLAQAHAAASRLQASIGLEPQIGNLDAISLPELTQTIAKTLADWERLDQFPPEGSIVPEPMPSPPHAEATPVPTPLAATEAAGEAGSETAIVQQQQR
ncbi:TolC family protein [Azonexus hydrophilus]|uniref:TolC family protein n=1 Tax=Azonexus hydrophilus TaxID=418702 RepID=UPI000408C5D7|nr:TolC family protein [Azonexus hydrophilus]